MRRLAGIVAVLLSSTLGRAAAPKVADELMSAAPGSTVDIIVQYHHSPTSAHHRRVESFGGHLKRSLDLIQASHYSIPANQIEALALDPDVAFIAPDRPVYSTGNSVYTGSPDYGWRSVGADLATSVFGLDGTGIGIALIDSGVDDSPDMANALGRSRIVYRTSLLPGFPAADSYGHGDHVAGILAGNGSMSSGPTAKYLIRGIAPNANIISFRVLDNTGAGTDSGVIAAIQQAILLKRQYNIRVINLSVGRPVSTSYFFDPLCQAVQQAWQSGIVVVVAAGNNGRSNNAGTNGYGTIGSPANSPYVITVGAMNTSGSQSKTDDKIASYSSKGPSPIDHIVKPDLVAPGNRILSVNQGNTWFETAYPGNGVALSVYTNQNTTAAPYYYVMSGTSMATPMVSGAAALMLQKDPSLTPDQVKARLMKTASKFAPGYSTATDPVTGVTYTSENDIFTVGAGYLDIPAALASQDLLIGPALSPTAIVNPFTNTVNLVPTGFSAIWGGGGPFGTAVIWGGAATWGTAAIWGSSVFVNGTAAIWGTGAVWGTAAIWGSSTPQAFAAIWGTAAIWGSAATWGSGTPSSESVTLAINGDK